MSELGWGPGTQVTTMKMLIETGSPMIFAPLGGAWWAAVYGVAQSQTRLKRLSSSRYNSQDREAS